MVRNTILVVDDQEVNRAILGLAFEEYDQVLEAENGEVAIEILKEKNQNIVVVLLDIVMPVIDGFGVLEYMNRTGLIHSIPVVLITGASDNDNELKGKGYEMGASDFVQKPFELNIVRKRVQNLIELYLYKNNLEEQVDIQARELQKKNRHLQQLNYHIIDTLGAMVEFRNRESGDHIYRVREYTRILLKMLRQLYEEYHFSDEMIEQISMASAMHDVGKIAISDTILLKPGRLTAEEFEIMKEHTVKGGEIIRQISAVEDKGFLSYCYEIARSHHERYDGRGYPDGLVGDEIPISAQVVSVADVYDALVSDRVYKKAYSKEKAFEMILGGECGQFNPKLMECFAKARTQMEYRETD